MQGLASGRCLALAASVVCLVAGALRDVVASPTGDSDNPRTHGAPPDEPQHRLAVVVPTYRGDLDRAVASLERWPTACSPLTLQNVDLVLYYAEGEEDRIAVQAAADAVAESAGRCFADLRTVYAHLEEEVRRWSSGVWSLARGICKPAATLCSHRVPSTWRFCLPSLVTKIEKLANCRFATASPKREDNG